MIDLNLDIAMGATLDGIGNNYGLKRNPGESDASLRSRIKQLGVSEFSGLLTLVITIEDVTDVPAGTVGKILWMDERHASIEFHPQGSRVIELGKLRYANGLDIVMDVATSKVDKG